MHADHFIWPTYGTWIPNCPRESWPRYIRNWERSRPSITGGEPAGCPSANDPYRVNRMFAEKSLSFPPIQFTTLQRQVIAEGIARCVHSRQAWVWSLCILPEYVQMLVTCPRTPASQLAGLMRSEAAKRLREVELHPASSLGEEAHSPQIWSHSKWHLQIKNDESIREAITYIEQLPQREGQDQYAYDFVRPFESLERCREEADEYAVEV